VTAAIIFRKITYCLLVGLEVGVGLAAQNIFWTLYCYKSDIFLLISVHYVLYILKHVWVVGLRDIHLIYKMVKGQLYLNKKKDL